MFSKILLIIKYKLKQRKINNNKFKFENKRYVPNIYFHYKDHNITRMFKYILGHDIRTRMIMVF